MIQGVGCVVRYSNVSGGVISGYVAAAAADGIVVIIVIGMMIAGIRRQIANLKTSHLDFMCCGIGEEGVEGTTC